MTTMTTDEAIPIPDYDFPDHDYLLLRDDIDHHPQVLALPPEIRNSSQLVGVDFTFDGSPIDLRRGGSARTNDSSTWGTFNDFYRWNFDIRGRRRGTIPLGYVISDRDPLVCIDVDDCRNPLTGELDPAAEELLEVLASWTEISSSLRGLHIFVKARLPHHVYGEYTWNSPSGRMLKVEIYGRDKAIALTGRVVRGGGTSHVIEERQGEMDALVAACTRTAKPRLGVASLGSISNGNHAIMEGSRNDSVFRLLCGARARGADDAALEEVAQEINSRCVPPLRDHELAGIIQSVLRYDQGEPPVPCAPPPWSQVDDPTVRELIMLAEFWRATGGVNRNDALRENLREAVREVQRHIAGESPRCHDVHRVFFTRKDRPFSRIGPRLCNRDSCPACRGWRLGKQRLAILLGLWLDTGDGTAHLYRVPHAGWGSAQRAIRRAGGQYACARISSEEVHVITTVPLPGRSEVEEVTRDDFSGAAWQLIRRAQKLKKGKRLVTFSRAWSGLLAMIEYLLGYEDSEDWSLTALGRGIPDATLRAALESVPVKVVCDTLEEDSPTEGLLEIQHPGLTGEEVARAVGYTPVSEFAPRKATRGERIRTRASPQGAHGAPPWDL